MGNTSTIFGLIAIFLTQNHGVHCPLNRATWKVALVTCNDEEKFTFEVDEAHPMQGDTVTLTCKVENLPLTSYVQMDRIDQEPGMLPLMLGKNGQKDESLGDGFDRYEMSLDIQTSIFTLIIKGILLEDSGTFQCADPKTGVSEELEIAVIAEPKTISLMLDGQEVSEGEEYEMKAGDEKDIKCTVGGSNPVPTVKISLEDKQGKTMKDLTQSFETESHITAIASDEINVRTYNKLSGQTIATGTGISISSAFSMKFVKCTGSVEGGSMPLEKAFFVRFSGMAPVFNCSSDFVSYVGDTDLRLKCKVNAEPSLTGSSVSWMYGKFHNFTNSVSNTSPKNGHYLYTQQKVQYENAWELILDVDSVHLQMFRNYTFSATNDHGTVPHVVTLNRDESQEVKVSGAAATIPAIVLTIAMALASLL